VSAANSPAGWLYKIDGEVFGPITVQELLEELYQGEIDSSTPVCPEGGVFKALSEFEVFADHLARAGDHQQQANQIARDKESDRLTGIRRRLIFSLTTALIAVAGFVATIYFVRAYRSEKVAQKEEAGLEGQLAELLKNVSIEPPLILPVEEKVSRRVQKNKRHRRKKKKSGSKRSPGKLADGRALAARGSGKLTQSEVMTGVSQVFGGFKRCIVRQIQRDRSLIPPNTKILLRFTIDNQGEVQSPTLDDRLLRASPMMACMASKIRSVRFRKYRGEVRNVAYPITVGRY
jgi:hypothetical protein